MMKTLPYSNTIKTIAWLLVGGVCWSGIMLGQHVNIFHLVKSPEWETLQLSTQEQTEKSKTYKDPADPKVAMVNERKELEAIRIRRAQYTETKIDLGQMVIRGRYFAPKIKFKEEFLLPSMTEQVEDDIYETESLDIRIQPELDDSPF